MDLDADVNCNNITTQNKATGARGRKCRTVLRIISKAGLKTVCKTVSLLASKETPPPPYPVWLGFGVSPRRHRHHQIGEREYLFENVFFLKVEMALYFFVTVEATCHLKKTQKFNNPERN